MHTYHHQKGYSQVREQPFFIETFLKYNYSKNSIPAENSINMDFPQVFYFFRKNKVKDFAPCAPRTKTAPMSAVADGPITKQP